MDLMPDPVDQEKRIGGLDSGQVIEIIVLAEGGVGPRFRRPLQDRGRVSNFLHQGFTPRREVCVVI